VSGHSWITAPASPALGWTLAGRLAAATVLAAGSALQLVSHLIQPALPDIDDALAWAAANPELANDTKLLDVLALPFLFGTAAVYVLLSRRRSPRLAYTGGLLLGCGLVGLSGIEGYETLLADLAGNHDTDLDALAAVADQTTSPAAVLMLSLLILGSLLGTLTLAIALWRSAAIPRVAAALVAAPLLVDLVFIESLAVWPHWVPHAISLFTNCWIGWVLLYSGQVTATQPTAPAPA
jgi:hypothetical protein